MNYQIKINGQEIENVKIGFTLIDRINEQFDTGTLIQLNNSNSEPIKPRSNVTISIDGLIWSYIVNVDNVEQTSYNPDLYTHNINIISIEKKYDYEVIPALCFTNKTDGTGYTYKDQLERIRRVYPLETKYFHEQTRIVDLRNLNEPKLYSVAPQLTLNRGTMYQAFSTVLNSLDLIPKVFYGTSLNIKKVNNLANKITNSNYSRLTKSNNLEYYVGAAETQVDNAITDENNNEGVCYFPSKTTWISFRSSAEGQLLSTDLFTIPLPNNIYKIKKIEAKVKILSAVSQPDTYPVLDITSFVLEQQLWNLLDVGLNAYPNQKNSRTKLNCAFYSYNGSSIDGFSESIKRILFTSSRLYNLLQTAYSEQYYDEGVRFDEFNTLFRIEYIPFTEGLVKSYKDNQLINGSLNISSSSAIVDFKRLGRNLKGMVNRIGNDDLSLKFKVKSTEDLINIGDYTEDGYVATTCEKQFFDDYIQEIVSFTKNYNRISQYMGINTEYRSYEIPRNGIVRHLHYDDFVVVSTNSTLGNSNFINNLDFIYKQFANNLSDDISVNNALVQTYQKENSISTFGFNMDFNETGDVGSYHEYPEIPQVPYIKMSTEGISAGGDFTEVSVLVMNKNTFDVDYQITGDLTASGTLTANGQFNGVIEARGNCTITVIFSATGYESVSQTLTHILSNGSTGSSPDQEDSEVNQPTFIEGCWALTHSYSTDKAVCFSFGFNDTVKAGNSTGEELNINGITGKTQPAVKYTDDEGRFYYMDFELYPSFNVATDLLDQAESYPKVLNADVLGLHPTISTKSKKLVVDKDPSEIIKMTYQISFRSEVEKINIGNAFSNRCMLTASQEVGGLKLYIRNSLYSKRDVDSIDASKDTLVSNGVSFSKINDGVLRVAVPNQNKNWCLANDDGEIYLTCNDPTITQIYIKSQHYL